MNHLVQSAYLQACMGELQALKPGNVHLFADGHGMVIDDFIKSAPASAAAIAQPNISLGQRILQSVQATQAAVQCNTNLGIVLLCAPIIQAALTHGAALQANIGAVLSASTVADAQACFDAIVLANPGGLGASKQHDVRQAAACTLLEAMRYKADDDLIARQYTNGFAQVFAGAHFYAQTLQNRNSAWATTTLYLHFLSQFADSHIVRKFGLPTAQQVQVEAAAQLLSLQAQDNPKLAQKALLAWDGALKKAGINPGTSADLTVASLTLHHLQSAQN